jgi:branched-chain amino acid transport system substrate-binding protein
MGSRPLAIALDAIADGSVDREAVSRTGRATRDRSSALGTYSLDENGLTTTADYGRLAVVGHQLVWDLAY